MGAIVIGRTRPSLDIGVRLQAEGRVREQDNVRAFIVRGRNGEYMVTLVRGRWTCTCPSHGTCAHAWAVTEQLRAEREAQRDRQAVAG